MPRLLIEAPGQGVPAAAVPVEEQTETEPGVGEAPQVGGETLPRRIAREDPPARGEIPPGEIDFREPLLMLVQKGDEGPVVLVADLKLHLNPPLH